MRSDDCGGAWRPIVAVPARNEEQRLPALLNALNRQTWLAKLGRRLPVVLVLNNCDDASWRIAAAAGERHPKLSLTVIDTKLAASEAHVGTARRLAMECAAEIAHASPRAVLITTDADAVPTRDWIDRTLAALTQGADLVGGHIVGNPVEELRLGSGFVHRAANQLCYQRLVDRLTASIDPLPYDPWPRHSDHTGASLAVRADVYSAVGGMSAVPVQEDLNFVNRVRAAGYRLRHALDVRVMVSARLEGRAPGGMADCLKTWLAAEAQGLPHLVEPPGTVLSRLHARRHSRTEKAASVLTSARLAASSRLFINVPSPIVLGGHSLPDRAAAPGTMPVEAAIAQLRSLIADTAGASHVI